MNAIFQHRRPALRAAVGGSAQVIAAILTLTECRRALAPASTAAVDKPRGGQDRGRREQEPKGEREPPLVAGVMQLVVRRETDLWAAHELEAEPPPIHALAELCGPGRRLGRPARWPRHDRHLP